MAGGDLVRRVATEVLGEERSRLVWKRLDLIGDIAILKMPLHGGVSVEELRLVAERLLELLPYVKSVWLAAGPVAGEYKVRRGLIHLAGERRTETVYKEHGCAFRVDVARVFVTPRLSYEHLRVARLVKPGEVVFNMFAGAGIFSVVIACRSRPSLVYSSDINLDAYLYMVENVKLNRVESVVKPIHGDAADAARLKVAGTADRILMPLPDLALEYMPYALESIKPGGGYIHLYLHVRARKGRRHLEEASREAVRRAEELGWKARPLNARVVRSVGPGLVQVAVDLEVRKPP